MATRRSRKALKIPSSSSEARRTNALLEALGKEVSLIADGVVDLQRRLKRVEEETASLSTLRDEVKSLSDVVRSMADDLKVLRFTTGNTPRELEAVKTELRLVRNDLSTYAKRLSEVEAKLAS